MKNIFFLLAILLNATCHAQTIDKSFGQNGIVSLNDTGVLSLIAIDNANNIITVGTLWYPAVSISVLLIAKFGPDGNPDSSFGTNGVLRTSISYHDYPHALVTLPDNKILVAGTFAPSIAPSAVKQGFIARYHEDGRTDSSFGTHGIVKLQYTQGSNLLSINALPSGKILVGGNMGDDGILMRLNSNGTPDQQFGTGGVLVLAAPSFDIYLINIVPLRNSQILCLGSDLADPNIPRSAALMLDTNGQYIYNFGYGGRISLHLLANSAAGQFEYFADAAELPTGSLILQSKQSENAHLLKTDSNGKIDMNYYPHSLVSKFWVSSQITMQPDGKILACNGDRLTPKTFKVIRLDHDGDIDSTFNGIGVLVADLPGSDEIPYGMKMQGSNKLLICGLASSAVIVRIDLNASLDAENKQLKENDLVIYPSPANKELNVVLPEDATASYIIYDYAGKVICEGWVNQRKINTSALASGSYLLMIRQANKSYRKLFIIQPE